MQQRGLARARLPNDGQAFATPHLEVKACEDYQLFFARTVSLGEIYGPDRDLVAAPCGQTLQPLR